MTNNFQPIITNYLNCQPFDSVNDFNAAIDGKGSKLSILHLNIRSLWNDDHYNNLLHRLALFDICFDVIVITETWINHEAHVQYRAIPGYRCEYFIREGKKGGGIMVYIHESCQYSLVNTSVDQCENVWMELDSVKKGKVVVGALYRPPADDVQSFITSLSLVMERISHSKKKCIIVGDINIDLSSPSSSNYNDIVHGAGFKHCILIPTRETRDTSTIIDHLLTNVDKAFVESGTIDTDISDHKMIFGTFHDLDTKFDAKSCDTRYSFKGYKKEHFLDQLSQKSDELESILHIDDVQEAYEALCKIITEACTEYKKTSQKRHAKIKKPYISKGLLTSINRRDKLHAKVKKQPFNDDLLRKFNLYRSNLKKLLKVAEKNYYQERFLQCKNNPRKTWQTISEVLNKKPNGSLFPKQVINESGNKITDPKELTNTFNNFFTSIGSTLSAKFDHTSTGTTGPSLEQSIFFRPVSDSEMLDLIDSLNIHKSMGFDFIHPRFIKDAKDLIYKQLMHIFNLSLAQGIVPDSMKVAKVIPVFKKGDTKVLGNYRPISILPILSKLLEKIVAHRLTSFWEKHHFLYKKQFGFRSNCGVNIAMVELISKIQNDIDDSNIQIGVFLDLSKAFDTVDHDILVKKLISAGVRGVALEWFKSYLCNRKQFVQMGNDRSGLLDVKCGIAQGSALGPLLFLLFVNDMDGCIEYGDLKLFADDTNIFYTGKNVQTLMENAKSDLQSLCTWFRLNKLTVNTSKSNYAIFKSSQKHVHDVPDLMMNDTVLERVQHTKYLGVYLDEHLNWKQQVAHICRKISPIIGIMSKARWLLSKTILISLYYSLIHSHISYCIESWGSAYATTLQPLVVLQKKAIRIITYSPRLANSEPLYKALEILPIRKLYFTNVCSLVFKELHHITNVSLGLQKSVNTYATRGSKRYVLRVSTIHTNYGLQSFSHNGPAFYNLLEPETQEIMLFPKFKRSVKNWILYQNFNIDNIIYPHRS